jgi:hypothetical protein
MVQVYYMTNGQKIYMMAGGATSYPVATARKVLRSLLRRGIFGFIQEAVR